MLRPLILLAALLPLAHAAHAPIGRCDGGGDPALGIVEMTGNTPETTVYLDDRNTLTGSGTWIYYESNGIWTPKGAPGVFADAVADHDLQRGGSSPIFTYSDPDICVDDPNVVPDTMLL